MYRDIAVRPVEEPWLVAGHTPNPRGCAAAHPGIRRGAFPGVGDGAFIRVLRARRGCLMLRSSLCPGPVWV